MVRNLRYLLYLIIASIFIPGIVYARERPIDIGIDEKVVAFGDVHGAYSELISLLKETGMVDSELNWAGKKSHLVSMGDLVDRGPHSRDVVDLMIKLQKQAEQSGGDVHVLIGNHELMAMTGDHSYANKYDFESFASDETKKEREEPKQQYIKEHETEEGMNHADLFDQHYPPGFIALNRAYGPEGYINKWLLKQPVMLKINDTVFVHGGIPSGIVKKSITEINKEGKAELSRYLKTVDRLTKAGVLPAYVGFYDRVTYLNSKAKELIDKDPDINRNPQKRPSWFDDVLELYEAQQAEILGSEGVTWYRGTAMCNENCESFNTERFLNNVDAARVVIGHTPTRSHRIISRMDGEVLKIDTGMLKSHYNGNASALIIEGDNIRVHYLGESGDTVPDKQNFSISKKLSGMSDAELEDILLTGEITKIKRIGTGITNPKKVTIKKGNKTINAVFKTEDSYPFLEKSNKRSSRPALRKADRYGYDVAAYRLDRMLDLQMIPAAVIRKIDGKKGVLQYWVPNSINERDRKKEDIEFKSYCKKSEQYWMRYIFDVLINNGDRNLTNVLWTKNDFMLIFIDHSRAFGMQNERPKQYRKAPLNISDFFIKKLKNLNSENLTKELSDYLHPFQIDGIIKRRDMILKEGNRTH